MIWTQDAMERSASAADPVQRIAEAAARRDLAQQEPPQSAPTPPPARRERSEDVSPPKLGEAQARYIAARESAVRDRLAAQAAAAAPVRAEAPAEGPEHALRVAGPGPMEFTVQGRRPNRHDARAEALEAEARLRVLERAAAGYGHSKNALR